MLDFLYDDIGGKIKRMAKWIFIVETIGAIVTGLAMAIDSGEGGYILISVFGPMIAWVSSWLLYAFGELVEDVHTIRGKYCAATEEKTYQNVKPIQRTTLTPGTHIWRCPHCGNGRTKNPCEYCGKE
jgi:hypothetical protein